MKLNVPSYLFFIAVSIIALMIWFWPEEQKPDTTAFKNAITSIETKLADTVAQNQVLRDSIKVLKVTHVKEAEAFKVKITRLTGKLATQRPKVDSIIFDNPVLIEYVNTADSVIEVQGHRIEILEYQFGKLSMSNEALTANFESQLKLQESRFTDSQNLASELEKDLKKEKRRAKIAKILVPIALVGGIILGGL